MEEKYCTKCGRTLPFTEFGKCTSSKDGLQAYCKECQTKAVMESRRRKKGLVDKTPSHLVKIYSNPELAKFKPLELIAELKARGYSGELSFTQRITV